ncbi:MAG: hypothetical protein WD011_01030 [Nitriliruptoraceae bacterium]
MSSIALPQPPPRFATPAPSSANRRLRVVSADEAGQGWSTPDRAGRRFFLVVLATLLVAALAAGVFVHRVRSTSFASAVDGYVMVEPGTTFDEVARTTRPADQDLAAHREALEAVNGGGELGSAQWQVVFLPTHP